MLGDLTTQLEGALFSTGDPLNIEELAKACQTAVELVEAALAELARDYVSRSRGMRLERSNAGVRLVSAPECAFTIARLRGIDKSPRLSPAALDTLAIVAYRQPATRAEVEAIRGVGSEHVLSVLVQRGLIEETGRSEAIGRPLLYGTTPGFLEALGILSLEELPPIAG